MKKIFYVIVAIAAITFSACNGTAKGGEEKITQLTAGNETLNNIVSAVKALPVDAAALAGDAKDAVVGAANDAANAATNAANDAANAANDAANKAVESGKKEAGKAIDNAAGAAKNALGI